MKYLATIAALFSVGVTPAFAGEQASASQPVQLSDGDLDQVVAGDPLIFVNVAVPINVQVAPIHVKVDVPINVAAVVQANVLGNGVFDAVAVGTQNVFNAASALGAGR
jgi:hypothetical protein